jgi:hypothetical protein
MCRCRAQRPSAEADDYDQNVVQQSPSPSDWESVGLAGVLLSRYRQDQQALLDQLGRFLEGTLSQETSVKRTLGVLGPRHATAVTVELNGVRYTLQRAKRGGLEGTRTRVVRGVAVRTESLPIEAWLEELTQALGAELDRTSSGRSALERLLQGGS